MQKIGMHFEKEFDHPWWNKSIGYADIYCIK